MAAPLLSVAVADEQRDLMALEIHAGVALLPVAAPACRTMMRPPRAFFDLIGSDRRSKSFVCRDFLTSDRCRSLGNRSSRMTGTVSPTRRHGTE